LKRIFIHFLLCGKTKFAPIIKSLLKHFCEMPENSCRQGVHIDRSKKSVLCYNMNAVCWFVRGGEHMQLIVWLLVLLGLGALGFLVAGIRFVPNNRVGIIEKRFSVKGSVKADTFIALNKEAGYQPNVLRGGLTWLMPIQYKVHLAPLVTIPQGQIGYVFARDGIPLAPTQSLGSVIPESKTFQEVEGFLKNGGQRGPQREILREGTYALNLVQFVIFTEDGLYYSADQPRRRGDLQAHGRLAARARRLPTGRHQRR
jgi:hypothetical protein